MCFICFTKRGDVRMKRYLVEFIGTFFLVFAICLTGQPLAIGLMLGAMVYMGGHISGGHYNPAVTLSVLLRGNIKPKIAGIYMGVQCLGAFVAAALFHLLLSGSFVPAPLEHICWWEAIIVEALFTFVLCIVILSLTMVKSANLKSNDIYGLAIGLTLTAIILCGGDISGGAFNPAVGVGPIAYDTILGGDSWRHGFIYLIGPFSGGILAAWLYKFANK